MKCIKILSLVAVMLWLPISLVAEQDHSTLNLIPIPADFRFGVGQLSIDQSFTVAIVGHDEPRTDRAVERFLRDLSRKTGMPLKPKLADASKATLMIRINRTSKQIVQLGEDESYVLDIGASMAQLNAPNSLGVLHGLQTMIQLVESTPVGYMVPIMTIRDRPRFQWRGLLIDVSRHFLPLEVLRRNLDGMAAVKMNVLHLHLSDNEGFRVESKQFPKLQKKGSDGLFYTQQDIRQLIAYARDRGIRVVPEFDMPAHSRAWFVGYPQLASAPGPYTLEHVAGFADPTMDPTDERTYKFLDKFVADMSRLFPDSYFHIGGDEVTGNQWNANPSIQKFIRDHHMRGNQDLQFYFNKRVQKILSAHGKFMIGWDEVLHPDLPQSVVIQSWRGQQLLATVVKQGSRGLLSFGYYLDLMWPAWRHYAADPMDGPTADLSPEAQRRILGGEACMWTTYVSAENVDSRIWPRAAAIAERLWSPKELRDVNSMYQRLDKFSQSLTFIGLANETFYKPMLRRIAGTNDISALLVLANVVEPVKDYSRMETASTQELTDNALNRLVDAVQPESQTARNFSGLVDIWLASKCTDTVTEGRLKELLTLWRDNDANLNALVAQSVLLKEIQPLSQRLSLVAGAGLRALDYLDKGENVPQLWVEDNLVFIDKSKRPNADVVLAVAPSIQRLIENIVH